MKIDEVHGDDNGNLIYVVVSKEATYHVSGTGNIYKQPSVPSPPNKLIPKIDMRSTVCPQSPIGVLKNCGAQTN
jgi:hypothetical protein